MASPNISFDQIPSSIRKPGKYFEFNTKLAVRALPANKQRVLLVGQRLASGTVPALSPVAIFSDADAGTYFGVGSFLHRMAKAALMANPYLDLTAIALDDASTAVAATGTIDISGPATGSGSIVIYIGNDRIEVGITSGQTAAEVATAINVDLSKHPELPVISSVLSSTITLIAKNGGALGNTIPVSATVSASGITSTVSGMSFGAVDPSIADALAVVAGNSFNILVSPYDDSTSSDALKTHIDTVSGPMEQRPAIVVLGETGALATATTLGGAINHGRFLLAYLRGTRNIPCELAAAYAAVLAGEEDPARPLNTLPLTGIAAPAIPDRLTRMEQESCLYNGVAPIEVGPGEVVQIVRSITTYVLNAQGVPDPSLLDITTIRTLDYVRKCCRERIALRFPREKLSTKTPPRVRTELLDVLLKLEGLEIVEEVQANASGLIVERDEQDANRLNAKIPTNVVNGLHVFAGRIDLIL